MYTKNSEVKNQRAPAIGNPSVLIKNICFNKYINSSTLNEFFNNNMVKYTIKWNREKKRIRNN